MYGSPLRRLGLVSVFLLIGSSNPVAIKAALGMGWPPFVLGLCRMAFIGLFFLAWSLRLGEGLLGPDAAARRFVLLAACSKGFGVLFFYTALWLIPVNRAVILSTVSPLVNLVLIHLLLEKERVRGHHVAGILISLLGVVALMSLRSGLPEDAASGGRVMAGDAALLASVVFHQAMIVFEKRAFLSGANPRQLVIATNLLSVLVFGLLLVLTGQSFSAVPTDSAGLGIFLYLITVVGVVLFYYRRWLVSVLDVSYLNGFSHLGKAISVFYAAALLGERITAETLACFALVLLGTLVAVGWKASAGTVVAAD